MLQTVTNVEIKKEIVTKCDTRLEQQCNTTTRAVPREVCVERNRTECFVDFKYVGGGLLFLASYHQAVAYLDNLDNKFVSNVYI